MTSLYLPRPQRRLSLRLGVTIALLAAFAWALSGLEISFAELLRLPRRLAVLAGLMFPPDAAYGRERVLAAIVESIQIAWVGTLMGAAFSFPLGLLAARNLSSYGGAVVKFLLASIRAFPEILLAILFVPIVGLGAFAGTLAVGLHSVGTLGKLTSEVVESIDSSPIEAVTASGGGRLEVFRYAVLPQVMPDVVAYWLYRFEINLRASAVLGIVGAGGVGGVLFNTLIYRRYAKAGAVIVLTVLVVLAIDTLSASVRRRIVSGDSGGSLISRLSGYAGRYAALLASRRGR
ncbi:MAG: phosphonate ABC transporter, permease protein PhnE [Actinomycetota bacterium]|nr:phosphonate ABC transporter, permease protein PhnE [Actinomycetota bacterium]